MTFSPLTLSMVRFFDRREVKSTRFQTLRTILGESTVKNRKEFGLFPTLRTILGEYLARVKAALNPHYDDVSATVFKMRDK